MLLNVNFAMLERLFTKGPDGITRLATGYAATHGNTGFFC